MSASPNDSAKPSTSYPETSSSSSKPPQPASPSSKPPTVPDTAKSLAISLSLIDVPNSQATRANVDQASLEALAASIARHGLINPITVKTIGERYELIAGARRLTAHQMLGRQRIRATILDDQSNGHFVLTVIENLQRANLSPMEEAAACAVMLQSTDLDVDGIAQTLCKSRAWVDSRLEMMTWSTELARRVHIGDISPAAARVLHKIPDPHDQAILIEHAANHGITRRTAELWLQQALSQPAQTTTPSAANELQQPALEAYSVQANCFFCNGSMPLDQVQRLNFCPGCLRNLKTALEAKPAAQPAT